MESSKKMDPQIARTKRLFDTCSIPVICGVGEQGEIELPMEDNIKLKTQYIKPDRGECWPVILIRCCYARKAVEMQIRAEELCKRGFATVVQWCRGINGSEGEWEPNIYDRSDSLVTMNWLQRESWVKNIAYWGDSYSAFTGWCMADAVPEKCKTMYLGVYGCDRHVSAYKDGLFRQDILTGWAINNAEIPITADYLESCSHRPQVEVDEKLWGTHLSWYRDWITNTDRDCEYWSTGLWQQLKEIPGKMKIPVLIREGWYDHHLGSALETYQSLSDETKAHSTFIIGPWNHRFQCVLDGQDCSDVMDEYIEVPVAWFKRILIDEEIPEAVVKTYVCGAGRWESTPCMPLPSTREVRYYLDTTKRKDNAFSLDIEPHDSGSTSYIYDPEHPVISYGSESCYTCMESVGSLRQMPCGWRGDVVSFMSSALTEDLQINGRIKVSLYVSTDVADTAFTAKLMEVRADKKAYNIRGTITTLAYRNKAPHRISYEPGSIVKIELEMWDIAWLLKAGSRLRIDISSSDFPQFSVHPNKTGPWSIHKDTLKAQQTIYTGKEYPSEIMLPVK